MEQRIRYKNDRNVLNIKILDEMMKKADENMTTYANCCFLYSETSAIALKIKLTRLIIVEIRKEKALIGRKVTKEFANTIYQRIESYIKKFFEIANYNLLYFAQNMAARVEVLNKQQNGLSFKIRGTTIIDHILAKFSDFGFRSSSKSLDDTQAETPIHIFKKPEPEVDSEDDSESSFGGHKVNKDKKVVRVRFPSRLFECPKVREILPQERIKLSKEARAKDKANPKKFKISNFDDNNKKIDDAIKKMRIILYDLIKKQRERSN